MNFWQFLFRRYLLTFLIFVYLSFRSPLCNDCFESLMWFNIFFFFFFFSEEFSTYAYIPFPPKARFAFPLKQKNFSNAYYIRSDWSIYSFLMRSVLTTQWMCSIFPRRCRIKYLFVSKLDRWTVRNNRYLSRFLIGALILSSIRYTRISSYRLYE